MTASTPIAKDTVVTLSYQVSDAQGKPLESGRQAYLHGGYGNTFANIEAALVLLPEYAFGPRDEGLVRTVPKSEFPPGVKVGGQLARPDRCRPHRRTSK